MPSIAEIRQQYPQYSDLSDQQLGDALHRKFYADMPKEEFDAKVGLSSGVSPDAWSPEMFDEGAIERQKDVAAYEALPGWKKPLVAVSDVVQRAGDGILFNYGDEIVAGMRAPFTGKSYEEELAGQERRTRGERNRAGSAATAAELAGGVKAAFRLPSMTGAAIRGGHGLTRVAAASAAEGSALGALTAAGESGSIDERLSAAGQGAKAGLALGAAAPLVVAGGSKLIRRAVSPFTAPAERTKAANVLAGEGIETTAGQKTGSKTLRYMESEIGGQKAADLVERQGEQFTGAALKRAGVTANRATPEVIDDAFTRIGSEFDRLAANNTLTADRKLVDDLRAAFDDYGQMVPQATRAPVVTNIANDIAAAIKKNGGLSGKTYQSLRSRLDKLARRSALDPELAEVLRGFRNSLDDAMERSLARSNPRDLGAWKQVRRKYRNMLVLEDAATRGAGGNSDLGLISPAALRGATKTKHGKRNYARGQGDFAELARAGEAVLKPLPDSGTASRLSARNIGVMAPSIVGAGGGGAYGAQEGGLEGAIAGALAGFLAPRAVGRLMMTKGGQKYLANQLMRGGMTPQKRALMTRLLSFTGTQAALPAP